MTTDTSIDLSSSLPYTPHNGAHRQYMRDIILGINDGLISTFLLVFAVSGGNLSATVILLTGITASIAGAISMGIGEYVATKSQQEVLEGDLKLEKEHFIHHREIELDELRVALKTFGLKNSLLERCVAKIGEKDETLLKFMMSIEFGFTEAGERDPFISMVVSGSLFIVGALPSVIPFFCTSNVAVATIVAGVLCCIALFLAGSLKTISTNGNPIHDGMENVIFGVVGAGVSYAIGVIYAYARV